MSGDAVGSSDLEKWLISHNLKLDEVRDALIAADINDLSYLMNADSIKLGLMARSLKAVRKKKFFKAIETTALSLLTTIDSTAAITTLSSKSSHSITTNETFERSKKDLLEAHKAIALSDANFKAILEAKDREIFELRLQLELAKAVNISLGGDDGECSLASESEESTLSKHDIGSVAVTEPIPVKPATCMEYAFEKGKASAEVSFVPVKTGSSVSDTATTLSTTKTTKKVSLFDDMKSKWCIFTKSTKPAIQD